MAIAVYNMTEADRNEYTREKDRNFFVSILNDDGTEKERITPDKIESESFKISMGVCSGEKLKFGLCEAAFIEFTCFDWPRNINGETIRVFQRFGDKEIDFGKFIVTSCKREIATGARKITAYDALYNGNLDVEFSAIKSEIVPSNFPALMLLLSSAANVTGVYELERIPTEKATFQWAGQDAQASIREDLEKGSFVSVVAVDYNNRETLPVEYVPKERLTDGDILFKVEYDVDELAAMVDKINEYLIFMGFNDRFTVVDFIKEFKIGVCPYRISGSTMSFTFTYNYQSRPLYDTNCLIFANEVKSGVVSFLNSFALQGLAVCGSAFVSPLLTGTRRYFFVKNAEFYKVSKTQNVTNIFNDEQTAAIVRSFQDNGVTIREALEAILELQGVFGSSHTALDDNVIHLSDFSEKNGVVENHALITDYVLNDRYFPDSRRYSASDIESCWYDDEEFRRTLSGVRFEYKDSNDTSFVASYTGNNGSGYYDLSGNIVLRSLCNAGLISAVELDEICERLYKRIQGIAWAETTISAEARPWVQAGDRIVINDGNKQISTFVFEKNQTGNISMYDEIYSDDIEY